MCIQQQYSPNFIDLLIKRLYLPQIKNVGDNVPLPELSENGRTKEEEEIDSCWGFLGDFRNVQLFFGTALY